MRGQLRSDLLMGEEGGREGGESTSKCLCMNEGFVLALPRVISKAIGIVPFLPLIPSPPMGHVCLTVEC